MKTLICLIVCIGFAFAAFNCTKGLYVYIIINFNANLIFSDELTKATDKL